MKNTIIRLIQSVFFTMLFLNVVGLLTGILLSNHNYEPTRWALLLPGEYVGHSIGIKAHNIFTPILNFMNRPLRSENNYHGREGK